MSLHSVPDHDWVQQARIEYGRLATNAQAMATGQHHDLSGFILAERDLLNILVHATLNGAPYEDLVEVAKICAAVVFLPDWNQV